MREKKEKETEEKQFLRLMEIIRRDPEKGLRLFYEDCTDDGTGDLPMLIG